MGTTDQTPSLDLSFLRDYQQSSISRSAEGVYTARVPWKEDKPYLADKLKHTPELLTIHNSIVKDQEQRGSLKELLMTTPHLRTHTTYLIVQSKKTLLQHQ